MCGKFQTTILDLKFPLLNLDISHLCDLWIGWLLLSEIQDLVRFSLNLTPFIFSSYSGTREFDAEDLDEYGKVPLQK